MTATEELCWKLAAACRVLHINGCESGISAHLSARLPGSDEFWAIPRLYLESVLPDDLLPYSIKSMTGGNQSEVSGQVKRAAEIFLRRRDVNCVIHLHSHGAVELATLDDHLGVYYNVAALFYEQTSFLPNSEPDSPRDYAEALGDKKVLILPNHGVYLVADTVEHAAVEGILFDQAAHHHVHAKHLGASEMPLARIQNLQKTLPKFRDHMWEANIRRISDGAAPNLMAVRDAVGIGAPD